MSPFCLVSSGVHDLKWQAHQMRLPQIGVAFFPDEMAANFDVSEPGP
jgi:hypothetical protein